MAGDAEAGGRTGLPLGLGIPLPEFLSLPPFSNTITT